MPRTVELEALDYRYVAKGHKPVLMATIARDAITELLNREWIAECDAAWREEENVKSEICGGGSDY